jgi:hypothetical protein
MPLDLLTMPAPDAERLAYSEGFIGTAQLFARTDELQRALGEAIAENESLRDELMIRKWEDDYRDAIE